MAAFFDDKPLVAGVNEDWDEHTTGTQIMRPDWDFSPIRMRTMHHLPQIFFDTLRPERPDCPVLIPSSFSRARDRVISQDIYSYEPCGLLTGNCMPAEQAQMRLMTASPITLRACIPAPDQVTPEQAYFKYPHPFPLSRARSHASRIQGREKSSSRLTIGSSYYPKQCSATYCHFSLCTPSGMIRMCATSPRIIPTARCVKTNRPTFSAIICNTTLVGGPSGFVPYQAVHLLWLTRRD